MEYWVKRQLEAQNRITNRGIKATEQQLRKYYLNTMNKTIGQFEKTYNKVLSSIKEEKEVTPADLYKLDKYWQMQGQLQQELQKLGDKTHKLMSKKFIEQYQNIYESVALKDSSMFNTIDEATANQMINQIWCADGKNWSERIWTNTDKLQQALNDNLIHCVVSGKTTSELNRMLQQDFKASFSRADALIRTEMAHIQTQSARDRYFNAGITEVEVLVDADERTCPVCAKLENKRFSINAKMPVPAHTRCRCCIIPVLDSLTLSKIDVNMNKSDLINQPASSTSGSNEAIREWYYVNIHNIPNKINYTLSLEQQAEQAYNLRNEIKYEARRAMADKDTAKMLNEKEKPLELEQLIQSKMYRYDMSREEALKDVIRSSAITRKAVDDELFSGVKK